MSVETSIKIIMNQADKILKEFEPFKECSEARGIRNEVPKKAGVYIFYDKNSQKPLYVGETINLRRRLTEHHSNANAYKRSPFRKNLNDKYVKNWDKVQEYINCKCSFKYLALNDHLDACIIERILIKHLNTPLNKMKEMKEG